jgi:hypothetical protein
MNFNIGTFLEMLARYNRDIWPIQIAAFCLAILCLLFALRPSKASSRMISVILSFFWLWTGIVFGLFYWGPSYGPAYPLMVLWIVQGFFFLLSGVIKSDLSFQFRFEPGSIIGFIFILYGLAGYPVFGSFLGHQYPVFFAPGLVPCPTNALTIGLLLLTDRKFPNHLLMIPLLWSISGFLPASKGILEDIGMMVFGVSGVVLLALRNRKKQVSEKEGR